ncbi:MAG: dihydrofolate reductase [Candidatus Moranbacteria bacterium CG06_land_8_20_14_3_00_40_12]|nr:MAG: dihydrofolate reductase [Candidatus Moranbacteria bacterium CG23_combo_of_CG06-09_8_20_14_all_40_16]PIU80925.1 MAG: dihydrofolate reductase [Candidatus Moranbacteria bacterium CG06_land_8_20_14_3_00_40_12]
MKIIMIMAMTLDGKIAKSSDHFPDWTSKEDKKYFAKVSKEAGVVIMGDKTFFTFPAPLKDRLNVVFTLEENPKPVAGVKWVKGEPEDVVRELKSMNYKSVVLGGGSFVNGLFLQHKLIDEIHITVEPKIFGEGLSLFKGDFNVNLKLIAIEKINANSVVLKYGVLY